MPYGITPNTTPEAVEWQKRENQRLSDLLHYGIFIERDGERVSPGDVYFEPPEQ